MYKTEFFRNEYNSFFVVEISIISLYRYLIFSFSEIIILTLGRILYQLHFYFSVLSLCVYANNLKHMISAY